MKNLKKLLLSTSLVLLSNSFLISDVYSQKIIKNDNIITERKERGLYQQEELYKNEAFEFNVNDPNLGPDFQELVEFIKNDVDQFTFDEIVIFREEKYKDLEKSKSENLFQLNKDYEYINMRVSWLGYQYIFEDRWIGKHNGKLVFEQDFRWALKNLSLIFWRDIEFEYPFEKWDDFQVRFQEILNREDIAKMIIMSDWNEKNPHSTISIVKDAGDFYFKIDVDINGNLISFSRSFKNEIIAENINKEILELYNLSVNLDKANEVLELIKVYGNENQYLYLDSVISHLKTFAPKDGFGQITILAGGGDEVIIKFDNLVMKEDGSILNCIDTVNNRWDHKLCGVSQTDLLADVYRDYIVFKVGPNSIWDIIDGEFEYDSGEIEDE